MPVQNTVSVSIVTYNSSAYLQPCLQSVTWANEIVAVDLGSSDRTLEILKSFGCRIISHPWVPIVELVRTEAIQACSNEWILVLDPDEVVPAVLAKKIIEIVSDDQFDAVSFPWKNIMFGRWIRGAGWAEDRHVRLFRRGSVQHSMVVHDTASVTGRILHLPSKDENYVEHYNYGSVEQFIEKLNRYTTQEAVKTSYSQNPVSIQELVRSPLREFAERYFWLKGYDDGAQGLAVSSLMGCYSLATHLKRLEGKDWMTHVDVSEQEVDLSSVRMGLLTGIRDIVTAMEAFTDRPLLRVYYAILRKVLSVAIRFGFS